MKVCLKIGHRGLDGPGIDLVIDDVALRGSGCGFFQRQQSHRPGGYAIQEELEKEVTRLDQRGKELIQENDQIGFHLRSPFNVIFKRNGTWLKTGFQSLNPKSLYNHPRKLSYIYQKFGIMAIF